MQIPALVALVAAATFAVAAAVRPLGAQAAPADTAPARDSSTARPAESTGGRAPIGYGAPCVVVGPDGSCDPLWRPGECRRGARAACPDGLPPGNTPCVDQDMDQRCDAQPTVTRKRGIWRGVANFFVGWFVSSQEDEEKEKAGGGGGGRR
ncbi:MAG TPA: hypothetical protein VKA84_17005 [Gemmatimonadaceae bacterium]|nr:hypothetical protein [Gemmatimonadaceae bacterium]